MCSLGVTVGKRYETKLKEVYSTEYANYFVPGRISLDI